MQGVDRQPELIKALMRGEVYGHVVYNMRLIETHISWVILTGKYAYKIKKPVDLGFLDFSTLEKRHYYCIEELRLNRRLAPGMYFDVITISGSESAPVISDEGDAIEYAVKMRQFPQAMQLDHMLERGELVADQMDAIARMVADFHQSVERAGTEAVYGRPDAVYMPVSENFEQIRRFISEENHLSRLSVLEKWNREMFRNLIPVFRERKKNGYVRECHGDMHLRNLVWYDDEPVAFDCIEFNPAFRWIDVISEIAFLYMDLQDRQQHKLAQRFLNAYLEICGDYPGVVLLPFYCCYRALVRAKVSAIRLSQADISENESRDVHEEFAAYLDLAERYTRHADPRLIITHGLSASGKTTLSRQLYESMPAIRIRSDVERKRLFGVLGGDNTGAALNAGIYTAQASRRTYARLLELAGAVLDAGYSVIIDAANLSYEHRLPFQCLAMDKQVPYIIIRLDASAETLRQRIAARGQDASDADLPVLEQQLLNYRPLEADEERFVLSVDTEKPVVIDDIVEAVRNAGIPEPA